MKQQFRKKVVPLFLSAAMVTTMLPVNVLAKEPKLVTDVDGWVVQRQGDNKSVEIQDGWITPDKDGNGVTIDYGKIVRDTGNQGWVVFDSDEEYYKNSTLEFDFTYKDSEDGNWIATVISPRVTSGANYEGFSITSGTGMERSGRRDGSESYAGISNMLGESFQYNQTYHIKIETIDNHITTYLTKDGKEQKLNSFDSPIGLEESTYGFRFWRDGKKLVLDNIERKEIITSGIDSNMEQVDAADWGKKDVTVPVKFGNGDSVASVYNGETALEEGTDYEVTDDNLIIKKEYVAAQNGNFRLQVNFAKDSVETLWIMKYQEGKAQEYVWTPDQGIDMWKQMEGNAEIELQEDGMHVKGRTILVNELSPLAANGEVEMTFEFLNDNWNRDDKNHGIGTFVRADQQTGDWQGLAVSGYVSSQPNWSFRDSNGTNSLFTMDGDCFVSRDGIKDYKIKHRFEDDSVTFWMDDQVVDAGKISQSKAVPGNMGIMMDGNNGDILVKKVVFREVAQMKEETGERETVSIAKDGMTVRLDKDFPRVADYELNSKKMNGSELRYNYATINSVNLPATAEITAQSEDSITYHVTPDPEETGVTFDVVFNVKEDHILEMLIKNIYEPEGEPVNSIGLPKQPLISADSTQSGASFDGSWVQKPVNGWGIKDIHKGIKDISTTATSTAAVAIITNGELSASMLNNVYLDGDEFLYKAFELPDGKVSAGVWNNEFMYRGLDGEKILPFPSEPDEKELYCRVAVTEDTNGDNKMDWQDGGNALKKLNQNVVPGGHTAARRFFHVGYNFASGAQQPFLKVADNMKRLSNYMDGFGQNLVFKGYANEGHDSGHADYEDVNKRAGGAADMNVAIAEADKIHSDFGIHINNAEAYPEAKMFNDHTMSGMDGWRWMDQSRYIRRDVDMISGYFDERLDKLFEQTPDLDFVYVDCWEGDRWGELKLIGNLLNNGAEMFCTENAPDMQRFGVWVHSTGGTNSNGVHQFVYNTQKDIYPSSPIYWGGYGRGASMMSWQHNNNINTMVEQFYTNQLPQKYLMCHEVLKVADGMGTFSDDVTSGNWVITKDGNKITDGQGKIFIPWYDEEKSTEKNPDEAAKIYHWNSNGGTTTWNLPLSWDNLENVYLYQTTQNGKKLVDTLKVTDGQITIDAKAKTPYVVYPGEAKADETDWSTGSPLKDTGFNSRDFSIWEKGGKADIQYNDDGNGVSILTINGTEEGCVSQTMKGLVPGQKYRVSFFAGAENGKTARVTVETPDGRKYENHLDQITMNCQYFDSYAKNKPVQRMWVDFTMQEGETEAKVTFAGDACEAANGKVTYMETRIVKTAEPDLEEKYVANETFEYVEQGAYGIFHPERSADGVPHLSETHAPYTNDTITGDWSLKLYGHYGQGDVTVRTSPATVRLLPATEYEVEFDTLGAGKVYVQSESDGSDRVLEESFPSGHSKFTFVTDGAEDYIIRIERGRVLDNFTVKQIGTAGVVSEIPGKVEMEDFCNVEGLELTDADEGKVITDVNSGDFAEYRVKMNQVGNYEVAFRVNIPAGKVAEFDLIAKDEVIKTIAVPSTNGEWKTVKYMLTLPEKTGKIKVAANTDGWQMNWMDFAFDSELPAIKVQAEDYSKEYGTEIDPVDDSSDSSNQGVGYINDGDWMEYEVEIPEAGSYTVNYRVSVNGQGSSKKVGFAVNGETVTETVLPDTGGWQNWVTISDTVEFKEAGTHTIRLNVILGSWNINWFELVPQTPKTVDKSILEAYVETYKAIENIYTEESWNAFQSALDGAKAVLDKEAATQEETDNALQALKAAFAGLVENAETTEADKADLKALITYAEEQQKTTEYKFLVPAVKNAFEAALKDAKVVRDNEKATQTKVDKAYGDLLKLVQMLDFTGNNTKLEDLVKYAYGLTESLYTTSTWEVLATARTEAKKIADEPNSLQAEIDEARIALRDAIFGLRLIPDKGQLDSLIKSAEAVDTANYTVKSAVAFVVALDNAKAVFADEEATEAEVKAAEKALKEAQENLVAKENPEEDADKETGSKADSETAGKEDNAVSEDGNKVASKDDNKADNKVASDNGSKKASDKSAAKTGDEGAAVPAAVAGVAALAAVMALKKKR